MYLVLGGLLHSFGLLLHGGCSRDVHFTGKSCIDPIYIELDD